MLRFDKRRGIPRLLQFVGIDLKNLLLVRALEGEETRGRTVQCKEYRVKEGKISLHKE
jgi:hypothetical protein